jgi:type I restriction enzyme R subunit
MTGKTDTLVLDFVNDPSTIQESFQPYYQGTILSEGTDPNRLYTIEQEIKKHNLFQTELVNRFVEIFYKEDIPTEKLQGILDEVVEEWRLKEDDDREDFRTHIQSFIRLYGYISQIISFEDLDLEKLYIFLRCLNKKLPKKETEKLTDILSSVDLDYFRIEKKFTSKIELEDKGGELDPISPEGGETPEEPTEFLSQIIKYLNESFQGDFTEEDKVNLKKVYKRIMDDKEYSKVHRGDNTDSNRKQKFKELLNKTLLGLVDDNLSFYNKVKEPKMNNYLVDRFYDDYSKSIENRPSQHP